jgi:hypothetical protein
MADPILFLHLSSIEMEFKNLITEYFYQLTGKQINFFSNDIKNLISFIKQSPFYKPEHFISNLDKNSDLDFNTLVDIIRFLHSVHMQTQNNNKNVSNFSSRFVESLCSELKLFRNLIHHSKIIEDELIQRFFENVYFFFNNLKLPQNKDIYSDYLKKEINMAIKCSMKVNIQKQNSFDFDFFKMNEIEIQNKKLSSSMKKKALKEKNNKNINRGITDFEANEFEYVFQNNIKSKIFEFKLNLNQRPSNSLINKDDFSYQFDFSRNNINKNNKNISYSTFGREEDFKEFRFDSMEKSILEKDISKIEPYEEKIENIKRDQKGQLYYDSLDINI